MNSALNSPPLWHPISVGLGYQASHTESSNSLWHPYTVCEPYNCWCSDHSHYMTWNTYLNSFILFTLVLGPYKSTFTLLHLMIPPSFSISGPYSLLFRDRLLLWQISQSCKFIVLSGKRNYFYVEHLRMVTIFTCGINTNVCGGFISFFVPTVFCNCGTIQFLFHN